MVRKRLTWLGILCVVTTAVAACGSHATPASKSSALEPTLSNGCGVQRWTVKTLQDNPKLHLRARTRTVAALDAMTPPGVYKDVRQPPEFQVYRLRGVTLDRFKLEADGDIHVGITQGGAHMIVEFPDAPKCTANAPPKLESKMVAARSALIAACGTPPPGQIHSTALHGGTATITGVLFFDLPHDKLTPFDAAPNAVEIHPALSFTITSPKC